MAKLKGHTSSIVTLAVTRDNKYIISGSWDKTIRVWNLLQKTQETVLNGHTDAVNSVLVTSNNKFVISGSSDKTIRVWNLIKQKNSFWRTYWLCKMFNNN